MVQPKFAGGAWAEDAASWVAREHGLSMDLGQPCGMAPLVVTAVRGAGCPWEVCED